MNAGPVEPLVERLVENVYGEKSLGLYQLSMRILSSRINPISMDLVSLHEVVKLDCIILHEEKRINPMMSRFI